MGRIRRFEDLEVWQGARELATLVYRVARETELARDFGLRDQIQRSAVSIMANIAEGFGRQRNTEFVHFLRLAAGSCAELRSHLYVALDAGLVGREDFDKIQNVALTVARRISAFRSYLTSYNKQKSPAPP